MAVPSTPRPALTGRYLALALVLLAVFWIAIADLQRESLWFDEGYSLYIIRDAGRPPDGVIETLRFVWNSAKDAVARARADVHPPLYFVVLDLWALLAGESVLAVRLLSATVGLIGLAATATLGRWLFGYRAGLLAGLVLGTASMVVYYSRETRMYTLLLALAALAMLAYWRWLRRSTRLSTIGYGILLAALLYTHYAGVFILLTQGLHLLLTRPGKVWRWLRPGLLALLLYLPWLPALWWQYRAYGGPAAAPFPNIETALAALVFFTTGGYPALHGVAIALNLAHRRRNASALLLLALWLLVTPVALLTLTTVIPPLFQVRYTIAVLPAGALLVAGGVTALFHLLSRIWQNANGLQRAWGRRLAIVSVSALVGVIIHTQISVYPFVWSPKPPWEAVMRRVAAVRNLLEPAVTILPVQSPAAYYDRLLKLRQGPVLNLGWRWQESYEMAGYVARLRDAESVWLMMPGTFASTWDATRELLADRHIGYRDGVMAMVFYRFDVGEREGGDLHFRFGDLLAYNGGIQHQLYARAGEDFCFEVELAALVDVADDYAIDFYMTQGYDTIRAIATLRPGAYVAGQTINLSPCIAMPAETPAGPHHLKMRVYNPVNNQPAPVVEDEIIYWGAEIVFALVSVE